MEDAVCGSELDTHLQNYRCKRILYHENRSRKLFRDVGIYFIRVQSTRVFSPKESDRSEYIMLLFSDKMEAVFLGNVGIFFLPLHGVSTRKTTIPLHESIVSPTSDNLQCPM